MDYLSKLLLTMERTFTSREFCQFVKQYGIKHVTSAPYHPSTNGQAECAVQTFKRAIECMRDLLIQERLSKFLLKYRLTPHSTTGIAPAELLMGRHPRSLLDNLYPNIPEKVKLCQDKQKTSHDSTKSLRTFTVGDTVFAENFTGKTPKWIAGTIAEVTGPLSYIVGLPDGTTIRRHVDCIRHRDCPLSSDPSPSTDPLAIPFSDTDLNATADIPPPVQPHTSSTGTPPPVQPPVETNSQIPTLHRSKRSCNPPDWYSK